MRILLILVALASALAPAIGDSQTPVITTTIHVENRSRVSSLEDLWSTAHVVLEGTVEEARPVDVAVTRGAEVLEHTMSAVRVVEVFKGDDRITRAGDLAPILQRGGTRNRGDHVERLVPDSYPMLEVGGRYVLFLRRAGVPTEPAYSTGSVLSAEGIYRIRQGRVDASGRTVTARQLGRIDADTLRGLLRGARSWLDVFGYAPESAHAIDVRDYGYPFVAVGIAGEMLWLPLDTGNQVGLSLEQQRFDRLGLPCEDEVRRVDSAGNLVSVSCVAGRVPVSLFGGLAAPRRVYAFTHDVLPGLVGPGELPGSRFTIDYARRVIAIDDRAGPPDVHGFVSLPLVRSARHPRLILVTGTLGNREVLIEIDTGKSRTTVDRRLAAELDLPTTETGVRVGTLALGPRQAVVESARIVDTSAISRDLPAPVALGIGSDVLSTFVWTVDYDAGLVWIEEPAPGTHR